MSGGPVTVPGGKGVGLPDDKFGVDPSEEELEFGLADGEFEFGLPDGVGTSPVAATTSALAGERYLTADAAIEDVARRARRRGDEIGLETSYGVYEDADGMFVPTRTRFGQQKSVESTVSLGLMGAGERTPRAYGHSHVYYMLRDQTPIYSPPTPT